MSDKGSFLTDYALTHLWQAPGQDRQHMVAPSRVTPRRGALGKIMLGMKEYSLPTRNEWYAVFVLGDVPHFMVGVDEYINKWVSCQHHCNSSHTLITIYDYKGMTYPNFDAYFLYTRDGQVALALRNHQHTINVLDDEVFIKWRSSEYFGDARNLVEGEGIRVQGQIIRGVNDISRLGALFTQLRTRKGYVWAYRNGRRIYRVHSSTVKVGDYLEVIWDGSVRDVLRMKLKDLPTFDSTLDKKSKYLVSNEGYGETIDFEDDIDVFLLEYQTENIYDGVYFHHNQLDAYRNVTHRDYSIPTSYVTGMIEANVRWNLANDNRLEVIIRHSGWVRPIPNLHVRLYELFRLPHGKRIEAMVGEHALIPEWTADNLESATFHDIMALHRETLSLETATEVFAYNATAKVSSPVIHQRDEGQKSIRLGYLHHYRSTVYEYNANGRMLGVYRHSISPDYYPTNPKCAYIEVYFGWAGENMGTVFAKQTQKLDPHSDYRFYVAYKTSGATYEAWQDVTGDESQYVIDEEHNLTWLVNPSTYLTAVRKDCDFLSSTIELNRLDRLLLLSIQTDTLHQDRGEVKGWLEIPPGELDVFLNGYHLVEGIDYLVDWPELCIVNTTFRTNTDYNTVHVRARGFCNTDMTRTPPKDRGFVYNRALGRRDRYQVREDKLNIIHANGRLVPEWMAFEESWARKELPSGYNGKPFQIRHPVVPLKHTVTSPMSEIYERSVEFDGRIENYLTGQLGIEDTELPRDIDHKYVVVSPFMNKLFHDLLNGIFPIDEFKEDYSDELLLDRVSRYNYLLPYEPTRHGMWKEFTEVHPHPYLTAMQVNVYQYRILDKVTKHLFNDEVALNRSLLIVEPGFEHDARYHPHPRRVL